MKTGKNFAIMAAIAVFFLAQSVTAQAATSVTANPVNTDVNEGESFSVDFDISTDADVFSNSLFINFNNSLLNVTGVQEGDFLKKDGNSTYPVIVIENDKGRVRYYCTRLGAVGGVTGIGTIVTVDFDTLDNGQSDLGITDVEIYDPDIQPISSSVTNGTVDVNGRPVLAAIGNKNVDENELLQFTVSATDPENDPLTYDALDLPGGADFTGQTFSWTPGYDQAGNYDVNFTVTDGSLVDYEVITITVNNVNRQPQITWFFPSAGLIELLEGYDTQLFNHTSSDPDGDGLTYSWKLNGTEKSTGVSWLFSPTDAECGSSTVTLNVSDGELSDSQAWTVDVFLQGDTNNDKIVNILDLENIAYAINTVPGDADWNPDANVYKDAYRNVPKGFEMIDILDLTFAGINYGRSC